MYTTPTLTLYCCKDEGQRQDETLFVLRSASRVSPLPNITSHQISLEPMLPR